MCEKLSRIEYVSIYQNRTKTGNESIAISPLKESHV